MILILLLAAVPAKGESLKGREAFSGVPVCEYIRLHVVAEDDGESAQALKLEVRDACLAAARELLTDCDSADEAWRRIGENLEALEEAAALRARALGYEGPVRAETGVFDFPDRHYGGVFVPAGRYRALRVVIGAGAGHNWWCVLYPSLCYPEGAEPGEGFHSILLDWLRGCFGGGRR